METKEEPRVEFGKGHAIAIAAVFAGAAIAIGVPAVVLGLGHALTPQMQLWLIVLAVCMGGLTCLTAAFRNGDAVVGRRARGKTPLPRAWDSPCETPGAGESKPEAKTAAQNDRVRVGGVLRDRRQAAQKPQPETRRSGNGSRKRKGAKTRNKRDSVARSWANSYRVIPRFSRFRSFALSRLVLASK